MLALETRYGRAAVVDALRDETGALRERLATGAIAAVTVTDAVDAIERGVEARLRAAMRPSLIRVINATGVIVHTNLGRAPLAASALARVLEVGGGYTNLEYDLAAGARGRRDTHAERLVTRLTGAEAAVVVNNNAAATLLLLAALADGREVIISRGELVEIGGGFRVPDVMRQSGALLREVGTTNRKREAEYAAAISDRTALILRVHPSNFQMTGFTERPTLEELTALGARFKVAVAEDLGSGWLGWPFDGARGGADRADPPPALCDEPIVSASIAAGADVVCFSGDKLLGGPQAGIIPGRRDAIDSIRRHPLMRALRGQADLRGARGDARSARDRRGVDAVPVQRMLRMTVEEITAAPRRWPPRSRDPAGMPRVIDGVSTIGGGSARAPRSPHASCRLSKDGMTAIGSSGISARSIPQSSRGFRRSRRWICGRLILVRIRGSPRPT